MDVLSLMYPSAVPRRSSDTGDLQGSPQRAPRKSSLGQVPSLSLNADEIGHLPSRTANLMIENCIGVLGIPLGLGLNFIIDGTPYSVPMAVEEPSVVAAASSAAKLVASHGGFRTATSGNVMTSQIQLVDIKDIPAAMQAIHDHRKSLIEYANTHLCGNMARRGGGVVHIYPRLVQDPSTLDSTDGWYAAAADELRITASGSTPFIVVHIDVDVCEAMGANIVNTIAEGLSSQVAALTNSRAGLRILTNLCTARRARASFSIPVASMGWKGTEGSVVAQRILEANDFAIRDPYRAVTNNKGILNGIDAAAVATGQDWRAIEASAHCFASRTGRYTSLSQYRIEDGFLHGYLELPLSVGSKGGALQTHPGYASTHAILGRPTAQQLSGILVSVGLAQNFAAIRALAITGINQGHMALHARNIAVAAGAPNELVTELCAYMLARGSINVETAKAYLKAHAVYHDIIQSDAPQLEKKRQPSMLYVEINVPGLAKPVSVNLAFLSVRGDIPQTIVVSKLKTSSSQPTSMHAQLLGDKGYVQLERMFMFLATMRVVVGSDKERTNLELQNKLLLLSILINLVMYQLMKKDKKSCQAFANQLVVHGMDVKTATGSEHWTEAFFATQDDPVLSTGLPLLLALWQVFHYHIEQEVANPILQQALVAEQAALVDSIANWQSPQRSNDAAASFVEYMEKHAKRWQATMFLLVDCLALDNQSLTPARLDFVKQAGRYIEWQGTVAHDLARFERAYVDPEERNVCVWFKSHVYPDCTMDEASVAFTKLSKDNAAAQWSSLEHLNKTHEEKVVHLAALESVVKTIVLHYGDDASKSRKLSF
ncbi:hydroxymethylglutaryl-CoA reductase, degradative [Aphanomyces invadans]|uniref:Hydroxymethylglutaryl-CoA reductase, degradative n=1 Tax=Aphanomyces invadans TaxID=157072 RepID=A0A024URA9_9STRA|nr:hydroxymethylglutaryl-CoA reductase, degradative [Aphanomyces invadans]ETW08839.1 hydroxymethylglutaryl-CoA reductase, degradative [Aphanomyces invadans]|eukprot:XP_008862644.1 hydroxymethylglutaryl-CoA reductase, degradative [Aphanomyces invadans]